MRRSRASVCLSLLLRQSPQSDTGSIHPAKEGEDNVTAAAQAYHPAQIEVIKHFGIFGRGQHVIVDSDKTSKCARTLGSQS